MRNQFVVVLLLTLTLAGCGGKSPGNAQPPGPVVPTVEATDDTGAIRGVVVDEAIVPIAGVSISLEGLSGFNTTTDAHGAFGFSRVPPGTQSVLAVKSGYATTRALAEVVAAVAEPDIVKVLMARDLSSVPFAESFYYRGFIDSSFAAPVSVSTGGFTGNGSIVSVYSPSARPDFFQAEIIWEPSNQFGDRMVVYVGANGTTLFEVEDKSPLLIQIDEETLEAQGVGPQTPISFTLYAGTSEALGGVAGVTVQQRYDVYAHAFYGWKPSPDYRFSLSGEPVPPGV